MPTDPVDRRRLLEHLLDGPGESTWLEFKENFGDPYAIGEYVSALANGAVLADRPRAYLVWGVSDTREVVGTSFDPSKSKVGNEDLLPWILRALTPHVTLETMSVDIDGSTVQILEIGAARTSPVTFNGVEYVRVGSYKKKLKDFRELERQMWRAFERESFETGIALDSIDEAEVLDLLDYSAYFDLLEIPLPANRPGILDHFNQDGLVERSALGWAVTNLGAILFAKDLRRFPGLARKTIRVVQYNGNSKVSTIHEREHFRGYAAGFESMIDYVTGLLPRNEVLGRSLRSDQSLYPEVAVRELVANMLIHQDFTETGTGPMIEIFSNRMEITNPGKPIIDSMRFVDLPPKSRNEKIASMMRRARIAEERGSGWDKVASAVELFQLPAPRVVVTPSHTQAVLLAHTPLTRMEREDRVRAVYLHASLREVTGEHTTNTSIRERFGISPSNSPQASKLLREAVDADLIVVHDPEGGLRNRRYVPYWAAPDRLS